MQQIFEYWFWIVQFYWIHFLSSNSFLMEALEFLHLKSCPLQTVTILLLPFQYVFLLFCFLTQLLWLVHLILCKWWEWASLFCSWCERKRFQLYIVEYDFSSGLVICGIYYVEVCFLYTFFVESFYHKCIKWILSNAFSASKMIIWFFILHFVKVAYYTDSFKNVEPALHPGIILTLFCNI